ncbi:6-phosphofructokinase [Saccharopolyspora sp. TS4A08]|uniref:6-phosphofructokinase n=1 Tax=Saccharopolyspora ipomoeae TaxID=3042027 RepID=A0ABT6PQA9_9PSEU|nr:6-phosphofructokinase [Saccharopolyspora sp. TS4A08]MDI2030201.1 6-phosphofructokinase [Saccharopolyspora sp. TS4A08]
MTTRYAIVQAGAPSPVINASVAGFLRQAAEQGEAEVVGVQGGANGLVDKDFSTLRTDRPDLLTLAAEPGAVLGAGRRPPDADELQRSVEHLTGAGVRGIAVTGGNGSMALAAGLAEAAARMELRLQVVGVPKTVDNDLLGTDRSPGFLTAGTYAMRAVHALGADLRAMAPLEQVRLVEVLGRGVGWLALAAALARNGEHDAPHLVYAPEAPLTLAGFLPAVDRALTRHGHVLVVVAEGAAPELTGTEFDASHHGRLLRNGAVRDLADRTSDALGLRTRPEVLGMVQRAASWMAPERDRTDAWQVGAHAARLLHQGASGLMVSLDPLEDDRSPSACSAVPLDEVAGRTRSVPYPLIPGCPDIPADFRSWWNRLSPVG